MILRPLVHRSKNELHPQLLGNTTDLVNYIACASSPRLSMRGGHQAQSLVVDCPTRPNLIAGHEFEYAQTTFKQTMPTTGRLLKVIHKFPKKLGGFPFRSNPTTILIYEEMEKLQNGIHSLGMVLLRTHHCAHQTFGFKYRADQLQNSFNKFKPGDIIPKGYVFADSPNVTDDGEYMYGVETDIAFMTIPEIIEDGIVASDTWCKANRATAFGEAVCSYGKKFFLLNLYGDDENYKPYPDVGEKIRDDGLLFVMRPYDELLGPCQMSLKALREIDYKFDKRVYAKGGAIVTDIEVLHDFTNQTPPTPVGMETQPQRYQTAQDEFYSEVIQTYRDYVRRIGNGKYQPERVQTTPELERFLALEALPNNPKNAKAIVTRTYRAAPLDDWWVKIKYTYKYTPNVGSKAVGLLGNGTYGSMSGKALFV